MMKRIILFAVVVLSTITSYGNSSSDIDEKKLENSIVINFDSSTSNEKFELNFDNKEDLLKYDLENLLSEFELIDNYCTGTLEVEISIGFGASYIKVKVTIEDVPCDQIVAKFKEMKGQLNDAM